MARRDSSSQGSPSDEKPTIDTNHLEHSLQAGLSPEDATFLHEFPEGAHKKVFRKVDFRLMPMLMGLYLIANLDRANLGNAKIEGLEADLNMKGTDYNIANMMFFVPYILFEVPSNAILIKFKKPSQWISLIVTAWGIVMTCCGFVQNWGGLVGCRVLLGVFEAGFFPGAVFILSQWYPPYMTQLRMSLLYCAAAMSGAFSGLLAAAIAKMSGVGGYNGWRWIFILEGILTIALGVSAYFILPDSPTHSSRWLTTPETRYLNLLHRKYRGVRRTEESTPNAEQEPTIPKNQKWKILLSVLTDWQIYLQALIFMSSSVPTYALKFTLPQIMVNMGFTSTQAQLLSAPPYIAGAISAVVSSTFADRVTWRLPFIVGPQLSLMTAYAVLFSYSANIASHVALCFTFVHVATISVYPIIPGGNTWTVNNLAGSAKRAMGVAYMIALGNCGGIIGSFIFVAEESPRYQTGWGTSLGFVVGGACAAGVLEVVYTWINKRRDRVSEEDVRERFSEAELEGLGDRSPLFRYTL
ncbi:major facilitator superfamily domain-containing protein [Aspergillus karnatakaensis]|uniref:major facilitator superfamily domain-containing protein n=1 Tax=Aspergillus karnatakaensis TaxID=1810916 RepID=UPI003CCD879C